MTKAFFKDAAGVILVYNIYSEESFDNIQKKWIPQVMAFTQPKIPVILVANKVDGPDLSRVVSAESGLNLAHEHSFNYMEASAKSGYNVEVMFRRIIFSVAGVMSDIKRRIDEDHLPTGWISLGDTDGSGQEYSNYWTGETTNSIPQDKAMVYKAGTGNTDNFIKAEMEFRDSFW